MEKMLIRYVRWHASVGHTAKTIEYHRQTITALIRWLKDNDLPTAYDKLHVDYVRQWLEYQRDSGLKEHTLATRVRSVRAFYSWLVAEDWLPKNPLARLKVPKVPDVARNVLTPQQVDQLLACTPKRLKTDLRDRAILLLLFSTGIRAKELCLLHKVDVSLESGLIAIRRGKGGKFRVVPLGAKTDRAIARYLGRRTDKRPELFVNNDGEPLSYWALRELVERAGKRAGIKVNVHLFRHSFAIAYLRGGGRLETLRTIMGHSQFEMTLHYARIAGVDVAEGHTDHDPTLSLKQR